MMAAIPMLMSMMGQGQQQDQQRLASVAGGQVPGGQPSAGGQGMTGANALHALGTLGQNNGQAQSSSQAQPGPVPNPTSNAAGGSDLGGFLMRLMQQGNSN